MAGTLDGAGTQAGDTTPVGIVGASAVVPDGATVVTGMVITMDTGTDIMPDFTMALLTPIILTATTITVITQVREEGGPLLPQILPVEDEILGNYMVRA